MTMKFLVINAKERKITVEEFDKRPTLADLYTMLDCDCIDITERKIGDEWFNITCDDEGLLKMNPIMSASSLTNPNDILVGNLLFSDYDDEGEEIGLTDTRIEFLKEHIKFFTDKNGIEFPLLLMD